MIRDYSIGYVNSWTPCLYQSPPRNNWSDLTVDVLLPLHRLGKTLKGVMNLFSFVECFEVDYEKLYLCVRLSQY